MTRAGYATRQTKVGLDSEPSNLMQALLSGVMDVLNTKTWRVGLGANNMCFVFVSAGLGDHFYQKGKSKR